MYVSDVVPEFASAFPFEEFNRMQRAALPALLERSDNVVASAPTASGKTALAELAICRTLAAAGTALFIAPLRALTNEKESEWDRFESLGYSVYVVTGERDLNPRRADHADILVMTPEKVDSATRNHDSRRYGFVVDVDCVVIDEVHLLDSDRRGSVLEVVVSRLRRLCSPRIVALSATLPNVEDVAAWLDSPADCTFSFGDDYRPVTLETGVKTYTHGENSFADKYRRLYRAIDLATPHVQNDGQALVFVASRGDTERAATTAREEIADRNLSLGEPGDYQFHQSATSLDDETLEESVHAGIGFHHAGLSKHDRDLIEEWFRAGHLRLLFSTTTLAWGVNLPARCVVIRDTKHHDPLDGEVDMSPLDVLQMLGRAGRPEYDDVGYGYIVCDRAEASKYRRLLEEGKEIESRLASRLDAHLNAEVAMGTVEDLSGVMDWLETTYYFHRARSKPDEYDLDGLRPRIRRTLEELVDRGFVELGADLSVESTTLGQLTSRFYLRLETAELFRDLAHRNATDLDAAAILERVASAAEFESVTPRSDERDAVQATLASVETDLDGGSRKVLAILHAATAGTTPHELRSDAWIIRSNAQRLLAALRAFCEEFSGPVAANLVRRVAARVEHGVAERAIGLTAIDGVGTGRAETLAAAGVATPAAVRDAGVDGLVTAGLSEGIARQLLAGAGDLPQVTVDWEGVPSTVSPDDRQLRPVRIHNAGGSEHAGIRVTVNGVVLTSTTTYLGETTLDVPVPTSADHETLTYGVEVVFPTVPLAPFTSERTVSID